MSRRLWKRYRSNKLRQNQTAEVTYGQLAKEELARSYCYKHNKNDKGAKTRSSLAGIIKDGMQNHRPEVLLPLLRCGFYVNLEVPGTRRYNVAPSYAIGPIMFFAQDVDWSSAGPAGSAAMANHLRIPSLNATFILSPNDAGNDWQWVGVKGRGEFVNELIRVIED